LVTTAHGTPTMKRWSFHVRSRDQGRPLCEYDSEATREEITWTSISILAGYRRGIIQRRKAIGSYTEPDNT